MLLTLYKVISVKAKSNSIYNYRRSACTLNYYGLSTNSGNLPGDIFVSYILTMVIEIPSYIVAYYLLDK